MKNIALFFKIRKIRKREKIFSKVHDSEKLDMATAIFEIKKILHSRIVPLLRAGSNPDATSFLKQLETDIGILESSFWITECPVQVMEE
jgi:hypothetical protein